MTNNNKNKNTEIRLEIDGEIEYSDLKPLFKALEGMTNFDFIIKISKIRLTNASSYFFAKPSIYRKIGDMNNNDNTS